MFLGQVYILDNQFVPAITVLKQAVELNSNMVLAQIQLAKAYKNHGDLNEARKILQGMSQGDKRLDVVHFMLAEIYAEQENYKQALAEYEAGLLYAEKLTEKYPELLKIAGRSLETDKKVAVYRDELTRVKFEYREEGADTLNMVVDAVEEIALRQRIHSRTQKL